MTGFEDKLRARTAFDYTTGELRGSHAFDHVRVTSLERDAIADAIEALRGAAELLAAEGYDTDPDFNPEFGRIRSALARLDAA